MECACEMRLVIKARTSGFENYLILVTFSDDGRRYSKNTARTKPGWTHDWGAMFEKRLPEQGSVPRNPLLEE